MSADDDPPAAVQVVMLEIQRSVDAGFANTRTEFATIRGQLDLLIHRQDQAEARADHQAADITALRGDVRDLQTDHVARAQHEALDTRVDQAVTRDQLDTRTRHLWLVISGLGTAAGVLLGVLTFLYTTLPG